MFAEPSLLPPSLSLLSVPPLLHAFACVVLAFLLPGPFHVSPFLISSLAHSIFAVSLWALPCLPSVRPSSLHLPTLAFVRPQRGLAFASRLCFVSRPVPVRPVFSPSLLLFASLPSNLSDSPPPCPLTSNAQYTMPSRSPLLLPTLSVVIYLPDIPPTHSSTLPSLLVPPHPPTSPCPPSQPYRVKNLYLLLITKACVFAGT